MIRFVASQSLPNWGVAIVAVFAGLLLTPRASEASCGDYVQVSGRSAMAVHLMPGQATNKIRTAHQVAYHGAPHRPCQGPFCSDGSFPPRVPAPVVVVPIERWAVASAETLPEVLCCDHLLADPVDVVEEGFRSSILRPPR